MKKKILCILLCISIILPCFVVFAFAESSDKYIEQGKAEGADEFVDVANYVENAGKPGCTDMVLLGIDSPKVKEVTYPGYDGEYFYFIEYDLVIYNPSLYALNFDSDVCGIAKTTIDKSKIISNSIEDADLKVRLSDSSTYNVLAPDSMFIRLTVRTVEVDESLGTKFFFDKLIINANNLSYELEANCSTEFNDIKLVIPFTDVISDLAWFTDNKHWDIYQTYKDHTENEPSFLFAYELGYGTSDPELYFYVFNPTGCDFGFSMVTIWGDLDPPNLELCSQSDAHLYKYKLEDPFENYCLESGDIRNYYIESTWVSTSNGTIEYQSPSHFAFSNNEIPEGYSEQFAYTYTADADSGLNFVFSDDIDCALCAGDEFRLYFSYKEFNAVDIIITEEFADRFEITYQDDYLSIICIEDYPTNVWNGNSFEFTNIITYSNLPRCIFCVPDEFKFTWSFRKAGTEEEIFDELFECICKINCDYFTYIPTTTYSTKRSSSDALYLKVNTEQVVELDLFDTYYRLDSSATGINLYQTLQSVYFTMPNSYLEKGDGNILNDRTVSAIEFEYNSAMMTPGIYTSDTSKTYLRSYIDVILEDKTFCTVFEPIFIDEDPWPKVYNADIILGDIDVLYHTGWGDVNLKVRDYNSHYSSFSYFFFGENYDFFEEVITSEEMLSAIKEKQSFDGELEYTHFVLHDYNTFDLKNVLDMSYEKMVEEFGFLRAFFLYNFGTKQTYMDSVNDIEAIRTVSGINLLTAINLDNDEFSNTYYVALSDVPTVKAQMQQAYDNNEAFVFLRFDVYDYYAADCYLNGDKLDNTFIFQGKYYENFDVINIELSNAFDKKVMAVKAESIDIATAVLSPGEEIDVLEPSDEEFYDSDNWNGQNSQNIKDFLQDIQDFFNNITTVIGVLIMLPVVIFGVWGVTSIVSLFTNRKRKDEQYDLLD